MKNCTHKWLSAKRPNREPKTEGNKPAIKEAIIYLKKMTYVQFIQGSKFVHFRKKEETFKVAAATVRGYLRANDKDSSFVKKGAPDDESRTTVT